MLPQAQAQAAEVVLAQLAVEAELELALFRLVVVKVGAVLVRELVQTRMASMARLLTDYRQAPRRRC